MTTINILAISGSLRSNSSNTRILSAVGAIAGEKVTFDIYEGLDKFPHFNPGVDEDNAIVADFRRRIKAADGVMICTPEYAFGIPGVLKNALDWIVSTGELNDKPVAAISASPLNTGGDKALASLLLTLTALGTIRTEGTALSIPNIKNKIDQEGSITDTQLKRALRNLLDNLLGLINARV